MYVECETFCVLIYFIEICFIGFIRILASVLRMNFKRQRSVEGDFRKLLFGAVVSSMRAPGCLRD